MRIANYGGGTNSTAMLIECYKRGIEVELILFADTGGEKPHTYQYIDLFSRWLVDHGMPKITVVRKAGNGETLEEACIRLKSLPSIAYGFKTCSSQFKREPCEKYLNNYGPTQELWKSGGKVIKMLGFDADETRRAAVQLPEDQAKKYELEFPLIDWDMGRDECIKTIQDAGLCLPGKSACFFCPSSKPHEVKQLASVYPDLMERALKIESNADLRSINGLGRNFAWKDVIATDDMFADDFHLAPELLCDCYDG